MKKLREIDLKRVLYRENGRSDRSKRNSLRKGTVLTLIGKFPGHELDRFTQN